MHCIDLGLLQLSFEAALISVPRDGVDYDWLNEDWIDTPQQIEIVQGDGSATVVCMTGRFTQKGRKRLTKAVLHSARRDCMMGTNVDMA